MKKALLLPCNSLLLCCLDLSLYSSSRNPKFSFLLSLEIFQNRTSILVETCLQFTFTKTYPDEKPLVEMASSNLRDEDVEEVLSSMVEEVSVYSCNFCS